MMPAKILRASRALLLIAPMLMLAACASTGGGEQAKLDAAPSEDATPADAKPADTKPGAKPAGAKPAAQASAKPAASDVAAAPVEVPLDEHQAAGRCWMKIDGNQKLNLDQKAAAVDKCVNDMMRADRQKATQSR